MIDRLGKMRIAGFGRGVKASKQGTDGTSRASQLGAKSGGPCYSDKAARQPCSSDNELTIMSFVCRGRRMERMGGAEMEGAVSPTRGTDFVLYGGDMGNLGWLPLLQRGHVDQEQTQSLPSPIRLGFWCSDRLSTILLLR